MAIVEKGLALPAPCSAGSWGEDSFWGKTDRHTCACPEDVLIARLEKALFVSSFLGQWPGGIGDPRKASCHCLSPKHRGGRHGGLGIALQILIPKAFFFFSEFGKIQLSLNFACVYLSLHFLVILRSPYDCLG